MINTALNNKGQASLVWVVHFQQAQYQMA
jgi:hypothetical protein